MGRIMPRLGMWALLCGSLAVAVAGTARAEDRKADQIVQDLDALKPPPIPEPAKRNDRAVVQKYLADRQEYTEKRASLIEALYKAHPDDARLVKLMPERWMGKVMATSDFAKVKSEVDAVIAAGKNEPIVKEASYVKAVIAIREAGDNPDVAALLKPVDAFVKVAPKDPRAASLMYQVADSTNDLESKKALFDRITRDYPDSPVVKRIEGVRRQIEGVGKPFDLEFTDAIKGSPVSIKGLKGKVVVIDYWATWCGPCIAEMPNMKKLYAEYKDQGVEFIGVSLDQPKEAGGLDKLKAYVEKNDIQWPQYYQGNFWQSDFSSSWGINSIPCVFLVDADGKLASVDARGKLETMIPEYLKKARIDIK